MTCPLKVVELGYLNGYSANIILNALKEDSLLISYDNTTHGNINDRRFIFKHKSQEDYEETDVDMVFFDASHDFELNKKTFRKVILSLNKQAIIAIHDTGLWNIKMQDVGGYWINDGYAHRPDERKFVNWIKEFYPKYQVINFHSLKETRHGMTLIQKLDTLLI